MIYLVVGMAAFILFFVYDINSIFMKNRVLHTFFAIGFVLLVIATAGGMLASVQAAKPPVWRAIVYGLLVVLQAFLLVYTLFFALPFEETYQKKRDGKPKVYRHGVYALCRHPGVLWFFFFYLFLALLCGQSLMYQICVWFTVWNLIYVWFQDRIVFRKTFSDYHEYCHEVPFLIPNRVSIRKCIYHFHN